MAEYGSVFGIKFLVLKLSRIWPTIAELVAAPCNKALTDTVIPIGVLTTGVVGVIVGAVLLAVITSPGIGVVFALTVGLVPTVDACGTTGTLNVLGLVVVIGLGFTQVTVNGVVADTEQFQPLLLNEVLGVLRPAPNITVVVIGPLAVAEPMLVTVTGTLLV
jgi:hypothetical protein